MDMILPKTFRNEEVTRLAACLIESIVEFQEKLGDTADPIASLDEQEPGWRSKLPLRLDDDVAASLFKNLVEESRTLAKAAAAQPVPSPATETQVMVAKSESLITLLGSMVVNFSKRGAWRHPG